MTDAIQQAEQLAARRKAEADAAFTHLVARCARGDQVRPEEILSAAAAVGKTPRDFGNAVNDIVKRAEQLKIVADEKPAEERRAALHARIRANDARLEEFAKPIREENQRLAWQAEQETQRMQLASQTRMDLVRYAPPKFRERMDWIVSQMADKEKAIRIAHDEMDQLDSRANGRVTNGAIGSAQQEERDEARKFLPKARERWEKLKAEREDLIRQLAATEEAAVQA